MNPFAVMLEALHADPNIGVDGIFTRAPAAGIAVRVSLSHPSDQLSGLGAVGVRAGSITADVLASQLGGLVPKRTDTLTIGATSYRVEDVERDPLGLTFRLTVAQ
ncbi:MAG: hypothetical protein NTV19_20765 [Burkholderiales bacterium]|nr:hypothetical protein [Burkholderiales bacterium]